MIMSQVRLNRRAGTQGTLAKILLDSTAADRGHSLVWSLFSETGEELRRTREGVEIPLFLFREIEPGAFLIVSRTAPSDPHGLWEMGQPKDYAPVFKVGQTLRFALRATPAIAIKMPGEKRGKRVDAIMHAKFQAEKGARAEVPVETIALDWLYKREDALGVTFARDRCKASGYRQVQVPHQQKPKPISFSEIDYEGVLTVADPKKLTKALFVGVGKAKAYGCGLLLVRPL